MADTAYSIPSSHIPTHTKHTRRPRPVAPVVATRVMLLERTPELYAQHRKFWLGQTGELDVTSPYYAETAPAAWLALPPMRVTVAE